MDRLSPELIDCILYHIVDDPKELQTKSQTLTDIRNCSLVSWKFAPVCQPHIFRTITNVGFLQVADERLMRLVRVMRETPNLARHVREIVLGFSDTRCDRPRLTEEEIFAAASTLLAFPNIHRLTIMDMSYASGQRTSLPEEVYTLLHNIVNTYLKGGTLSFLYVMALKDLNVASILSHSSLQELQLGGYEALHIEPSCRKSKNITCFGVHSFGAFDLSVLTQLPRLDKLSISARSLDLPTTASPYTTIPSLQLQHLVLKVSLPQMVSKFVGFYQGYARLSRAFRTLRVLECESPYDDSFQALDYILHESIGLKSLTIKTGYSDMDSQGYTRHTESLLMRLSLHSKILNVFPSLTSLEISLLLTTYPEAYNETVSQLAHLVSSIARQNVIEELSFFIQSISEQWHLPSSQPWTRIGQLLASPLDFPRLRIVEMSIIFQTNEEVFVDLMYSDWDYSDLDTIMETAKRLLVSRGVKFTSDVHLSRN